MRSGSFFLMFMLAGIFSGLAVYDVQVEDQVLGAITAGLSVFVFGCGIAFAIIHVAETKN